MPRRMLARRCLGWRYDPRSRGIETRHSFGCGLNGQMPQKGRIGCIMRYSVRIDRTRMRRVASTEPPTGPIWIPSSAGSSSLAHCSPTTEFSNSAPFSSSASVCARRPRTSLAGNPIIMLEFSRRSVSCECARGDTDPRIFARKAKRLCDSNFPLAKNDWPGQRDDVLDMPPARRSILDVLAAASRGRKRRRGSNLSLGFRFAWTIIHCPRVATGWLQST
jgi:hypothetical protein